MSRGMRGASSWFWSSTSRLVGRGDLEPPHVAVAATVTVEYFGTLLQGALHIGKLGHYHAHLSDRAASSVR